MPGVTHPAVRARVESRPQRVPRATSPAVHPRAWRLPGAAPVRPGPDGVTGLVGPLAELSGSLSI